MLSLFIIQVWCLLCTCSGVARSSAVGCARRNAPPDTLPTGNGEIMISLKHLNFNLHIDEGSPPRARLRTCLELRRIRLWTMPIGRCLGCHAAESFLFSKHAHNNKTWANCLAPPDHAGPPSLSSSFADRSVRSMLLALLSAFGSVA
jgi:hypothetical protein